jgi:hypothetical protein
VIACLLSYLYVLALLLIKALWPQYSNTLNTTVKYMGRLEAYWQNSWKIQRKACTEVQNIKMRVLNICNDVVNHIE